MKTSHYTTPRQLSDCGFVPSADPITRYASKAVTGISYALFIATLVGIGAICLLAYFDVLVK